MTTIQSDRLVLRNPHWFELHDLRENFGTYVIVKWL